MSENDQRLPPEAYEVCDGETYPPYVKAEKKIPEMTVRAIVLGFVLSIVLGAANAYLGLKVGITVSASIPAAVISMGILRGVLRKGNVLENNIVQTIASSGEALAAGVIFTIPGLYLMGLSPSMLSVTLMAALGGLLGLLFMIPLRRFLIVREHGKLTYPEGLACAEVLVAGEAGGNQARGLFASMGIAGLYRFLQAGFGIFPQEVEWRIKGFPGAILGGDIYPALLGVGFIIGPRIGVVMVTGGLVAWLVIIPLFTFVGTHLPTAIFPATTPIAQLGEWGIWSSYVRYLGAGAVAFGGILSFIESFPVIVKSFRSVLRGLGEKLGIEVRTQRDLPGLVVLLGSFAVALALLFLLPIDNTLARVIAAISCVVLGFFFVTVSSRIVGIVGSSNNPVSGMTIATLLLVAVLVKLGGISGKEGIIASLAAGSVICIALAVAGDMSQDLKTGFLVGATPKYQQIGEMIGVVAAALVIGYIMHVLNLTYGFGSKELPAPQGTLMALVVRGIFEGNLPWTLVWIGAALGLCARLAGLPVLPFGVGLYLPIHLSMPIFVGAILRKLILRKLDEKSPEYKAKLESGILTGSGLVAGDAIVGLIVAFLAYLGVADKIAFGQTLGFGKNYLLGVAFFVLLVIYLWRKTKKATA